MRVLLLGGTTEASDLARRIAADPNIDVTLSLAGRTANPIAQPLPTRIGGFGGAGGLVRWLKEQSIEAVIDVTHPYAAQISANAVAACTQTGVPLATFVRPPWRQVPGDNWQKCNSAVEAASALGEAPRRVFLSLGRLGLAAFAAAPQHDYVARTIDVPGAIDLPPRIRFIFDRGPFKPSEELQLLQAEKIEVIVSKNSGGTATYGKIEAARELGLPVILIERPHKPFGHAVESAEAAIVWLHALNRHDAPPGSRLGV